MSTSLTNEHSSWIVSGLGRLRLAPADRMPAESSGGKPAFLTLSFRIDFTLGFKHYPSAVKDSAVAWVLRLIIKNIPTIATSVTTPPTRITFIIAAPYFPVAGS